MVRETELGQGPSTLFLYPRIFVLYNAISLFIIQRRDNSTFRYLNLEKSHLLFFWEKQVSLDGKSCFWWGGHMWVKISSVRKANLSLHL